MKVPTAAFFHDVVCVWHYRSTLLSNAVLCCINSLRFFVRRFRVLCHLKFSSIVNFKRLIISFDFTAILKSFYKQFHIHCTLLIITV